MSIYYRQNRGNLRIFGDQMQGSMAILNKQWCDYIVYFTPENRVFVGDMFYIPSY